MIKKTELTKNHHYFRKLFLFSLTTLFIITAAYYLVVNTVLRERVLPNVFLEGRNIAFIDKDSLEVILKTKIIDNLPQLLKVSTPNYYFDLETTTLDPNVDVNSIIDYGKGSPAKVLDDTLNLLAQKEIDYKLNLNIESFLSNLPFKIAQKDSAYIENGIIKNCQNYIFDFNLDTQRLNEDLSRSLKEDKLFEFEPKNYLATESEKQIWDGCKIFKDSSDKVLGLSTKISPNKQIFELANVEEGFRWQIVNEEELTQNLISFKSKSDSMVDEGISEVISGKIALFKDYIVGKSLDIEKTKAKIIEWMQTDYSTDPLVYDKINPAILSKGMEILDFTQKISEGKTRLHLVNDNLGNEVYYAEVGFRNVHNSIIYPNGTFSMFDTIAPQPGYLTAKTGELIAGGICGTATSIFRVALEAGLPINERYNHGKNYAKYQWPYDYGIVDATYLTDPKIDVRFSNDFSEPVILRYESYDDGGYRYNSLVMYGSQKIQKRNVELKNWKIWDNQGAGIFKASFERLVKVGDQVLSNDTYKSNYTWN